METTPETQSKSQTGSHRLPPGREDWWSEDATATLIEAWGDRYVNLSRGNLRQNDWKEVADAVNSTHGNGRPKTDVQCKNRIDKLKKKYKTETAKPSSSWCFFERLDFLIGSVAAKKSTGAVKPALKNHTLNPTGSKSSGSSLEDDDDEEEDDDEVGNWGFVVRKHRRVDDVDPSEGEGSSCRELARAVLKLGEVYERMEGAKQRMMVELEKQRMEAAKELGLQRMNMLMDMQMERERSKLGKRRAASSGTKSGKNKTVANPVSGIMSAQEDLLLTTRHKILMENHESLKQDYASLEQRFKLVDEMNEMLKPRIQNQNQSKELEAANLRLVKDLERERKEKEEYKKMVEEMQSKSEATINELMVRNEELLVVLEEEEEEVKKKERKYDELAKRCGEIEKECERLKSMYDDAKKLNNVGLEDEVFVVGVDHNVNNNTVADAIVISGESDAESDRPTRESNINTPLRVVIKQEEEGSNGVNSSQVKHPLSSKMKHPSSSSSSSSSSDVYLVPLKRFRDDDYNKTC